MKILFASTLAVATLSQAVTAATVVQFDSALGQGSGNFAVPTVDGSQDLNGDTHLDNRLTNAFSAVTPLNNGVGTYTGPDIFGGLTGDALRGPDGSGTPDTSFDNRGLATFSWRHQVTAPVTGNVHAAIYFEVDGVAYPSGVQLDGTSWFGFSSLADGSVDGVSRFENLGQVRFMVATTNGAFYVSNTAAADNADGRILDGTELATETWQLFDPAANLNFDATGASFLTSTSDLNTLGVSGFGMVVDKDTYSTTRHWLEFTKFYADAVVPEPSTFALVAGLACFAGLALFRRRQK